MGLYNKRTWLNKEDSPSLGSIVLFDGEVKYSDGIERTTFLAISDCHHTIKLIKNTESTEDYIKKMKLLKSEIELFINHLNGCLAKPTKPVKISSMRDAITREIIEIVFPHLFNDGRYMCGRVGICPSGNGWYINTVQNFVGKQIKTIDQLDRFLKKEGVPFDFTSINDNLIKK
jgi:hypothetical protein